MDVCQLRKACNGRNSTFKNDTVNYKNPENHEMVCEWCVISCMLSAGNNDGLTPPLYAADKHAGPMMRKLGPFLYECESSPALLVVGLGVKKWLSAPYPIYTQLDFNPGTSLANPWVLHWVPQDIG